jgi:hypothetical protein
MMEAHYARVGHPDAARSGHSLRRDGGIGKTDEALVAEVDHAEAYCTHWRTPSPSGATVIRILRMQARPHMTAGSNVIR